MCTYKAHWHFHLNCIESIDQFERIDILAVSDHEYWVSLPFLSIVSYHLPVLGLVHLLSDLSLYSILMLFSMVLTLPMSNYSLLTNKNTVDSV